MIENLLMNGTGEKPELQNSRVAVIDADSLAWIIGWSFKDNDDVDSVIEKTDDFMHSILQATQARLYIGVLSAKNTEELAVANFRASIAITKPYKGNRGEKPEWYLKWSPIIENHLLENWKFIRCAYNIEADDLVASICTQLPAVEPTCTVICCQNDKDLQQVPGHHYNFVKNAPMEITPAAAALKLFTQVLTGDTTDNIPGLHKCGPKGAEAIMANPDMVPQTYHLGVMYAFTEKLGVDKGIQSFYENYMLCKLRDDLNFEILALNSYDLDAGAVRSMVAKEEVEDIVFNADPEADSLFTVE